MAIVTLSHKVFEVAKKGSESPSSTSSDGGRPLEREGPLKTDVVPYSQYRQQRLDNIRGSVGLPGRVSVLLGLLKFIQPETTPKTAQHQGQLRLPNRI